MYKLLTDKGQLFALILGLVCIAVFFVTVLSGISGAGYSVSDDLNQIMKNNADADFSFFNPGITLVLILIVVAFVIATLFGLFQLLSSPKNSMKGIIGAIAVVVIFFITYSMGASDTVGAIAPTLQKFDISELISKLISGGISTVGILSAAAVVLVIVFEIFNFFK